MIDNHQVNRPKKHHFVKKNLYNNQNNIFIKRVVQILKLGIKQQEWSGLLASFIYKAQTWWGTYTPVHSFFSFLHQLHVKDIILLHIVHYGCTNNNGCTLYNVHVVVVLSRNKRFHYKCQLWVQIAWINRYVIQKYQYCLIHKDTY